jgi:mannosylglucosylglycerate synthase
MTGKKEIKKLRYGIIHSQVGFSDGVSVVINQIESVMANNLEIPKSNIYYLVGKSKKSSPYITRNKHFWHKSRTNKIVNKNFCNGFGGELNEEIENSIREAKETLKKFIEDKKIDVIIAHNTAHPVNFIYSLAISRYYRDMKKKGEKTPKYILWWHYSHLERERYQNPSGDVSNYLLEGLPGKYVDYIIFINKLQFKIAQKYFKSLDSKNNNLSEIISNNRTVIYNTASTPVNSIRKLKNRKNAVMKKRLLKDFKIEKTLKEKKLKLKDTLFILQHTRIIERKKIDFALEYSYELLSQLKKRKIKKGAIFFVSGKSGDERGNYKRKLILLNKKLAKKYNTNKFVLIFKEDYESEISFEEIPVLFSSFGGISMYFSKIEGFGNNLLEVMAGGLIPIIYTYPVYVSDIAKYKFNVINLKEFKISQNPINQTIDIICRTRKRIKLANENIEILKRNFSHETIAPKLKEAILKKSPKIKNKKN